VQGDKKRPLDADVVEAISICMDSLVQSVEDGVVYKDLEGLGRYVRWTLDVAQYEMSLTILRADLRQRQEDRVSRALLEFRTKNGPLAKNIQWGWCPIWRVLCTSENILHLRTPPAAMET
jgi:hypothetical protein